MERKYLPTRIATVRPGEPVDINDMIMYFVQREDKGIEGFVRDESHLEPEVMSREVTINRRTPLTRNWGLRNVRAFIA